MTEMNLTCHHLAIIVYRKPEVVKILASYKKGSTEIGSAMRVMIKLKYVPVCLCSLHRLIERASIGESILDTGWLSSSGGRTPVASLNKVKAIAENMENQSGRIVSQEDVVKLLSDHHMKKIEDAGFVPVDSPKFSSQTMRNYTALIASQANISISQTSTVKTTTRFAAENSIHANERAVCETDLYIHSNGKLFSVSYNCCGTYGDRNAGKRLRSCRDS